MKDNSVMLIKRQLKKMPSSFISFMYKGSKYDINKLDTFSAYSYKEGEDVELDITFFENIKDPYSDDIPFAIVTDIRKKEKCNR